MFENYIFEIRAQGPISWIENPAFKHWNIICRELKNQAYAY